jgi:hypothetical protein
LISQEFDFLGNNRACICSNYRWHAFAEKARRAQTGMAQITRTEPASSATEGAGDDTLVARMIAAGGILGALAASACCILPLVLFSVGMLS